MQSFYVFTKQVVEVNTDRQRQIVQLECCRIRIKLIQGSNPGSSAFVGKPSTTHHATTTACTVWKFYGNSGKLGRFNSECLASGTELFNEILKGVVLFVFHQSCRAIAKHSSES